MPTRRTGSKRMPRRASKRNVKKKAPSNKNLNKKIKHIENNLIELKHIDTYDAVLPLNVAGQSSYLLPLAQGDTTILRNGNKISPTSVQWKMTLFTDNDLLNSSEARCLLIWDRQANGAAPILTGANGLIDVSIVSNPTLAPLNYDAINRYKVLWDKHFTLTPQVVLNTPTTVTTQVVTVEKHWSGYRKLGRQVKFSGTGATVASILTNSLFLVWFTDSDTNPISVEFGTRVYFRDA